MQTFVKAVLEVKFPLEEGNFVSNFCLQEAGLFMMGFNPLPLLFKALLHGQKDRIFSAGI